MYISTYISIFICTQQCSNDWLFLRGSILHLECTLLEFILSDCSATSLNILFLSLILILFIHAQGVRLLLRNTNIFFLNNVCLQSEQFDFTMKPKE
jgi:hypothetical protein